jgi:cell division protein FtsB
MTEQEEPNQSSDGQTEEEATNAADRFPEAPDVGEIPFSLVKRHDKKSVQLLTNSGKSDRAIAGRRVWHKFEFKEDVFAELISIKVSDYNEYASFDFYYVDYKGNRVEKTFRPTEGRVSIKTNTIVSELGFRPPRRPFFSPKILSVSLYGFQLNDSYKYGEFADQLERIRSEIAQELDDRSKQLDKREAVLEALEGRRDDLKSEISELQSEKGGVESELQTLREQRNVTSARIETQGQSVRQNEQKLEDAKNAIARASEVRSKLAGSIIEKRSLLKSLKGNINLFPSELSDFVEQGSNDIRLYSILAAIPMAVIAAMFMILVSGAVDLTTKITGDDSINIWALLVSRMPFVVVAVTVVTACYYLARMFVLEMVRVNRQKLSLSKIGIVAKDISYSTDVEIDMAEDEKQERRLRLKMDMLRDHLKEYLSRDFEPSLPKRSPFQQLRIPGLTGANEEETDDDVESEGTHEDENGETS